MTGAAELSGRGGSLVGAGAAENTEAALEEFAPPEITVLGVGNVVLSDEGFGVRLAEILDAAYDFPENVQVLDGGTLGLELLRFVTGTRKLLILDAVRTDEHRGGCYRFAGEEAKAHFREKLSAHEIGVQDVLTFLEITGKPIGEVVVIGAEPVTLEAGLELSPAMEALLPTAAAMAAAELTRWGARLKRKDGTENEA